MLNSVSKPTLKGDLVTLRPVAVQDVETLQALMADHEVSRLTGSVRSEGESSAGVWTRDELEKIYRQWSTAADRLVWVIIERDSGQIVGESVLNDLNEANRSCGFRIWIAGARDRGLGTESTWLTVRYAFEEVGLHRVELEVYDFNPRARRVYEKVGFVHEGTRREALRFDEEWVDAHQMSMLASDWWPARGG